VQKEKDQSPKVILKVDDKVAQNVLPQGNCSIVSFQGNAQVGKSFLCTSIMNPKFINDRTLRDTFAHPKFLDAPGDFSETSVSENVTVCTSKEPALDKQSVVLLDFEGTDSVKDPDRTVIFLFFQKSYLIGLY
jgi:hypothetical protein